MNRRSVLFTLMFGLFLTLASDSFADGMVHTGDAVRVKSLGFMNFNVYGIRHDMKEKPATKSKQAVIDADVDKKFTFQMLRGVTKDQIQGALRDAFKLNGYGDAGKIEQFVSVFKDELKEKAIWGVSYAAGSKAVTIWVNGGANTSIADPAFMKAVWSIWFGKIDQPTLGDQLISKL
jgi:hypothetical protein